VDKQIDILATAIQVGLTVDQLAELELAYAPPFGSAKNPVNMAGFLAQNVLAERVRLVGPAEYAGADGRGADQTGLNGPDAPADGPPDAFPGEVLVDVRGPGEFDSGALPGAINLPLPQLRDRLGELDPSRPVLLYCASGFRSYLASQILRQRGFDQVRSLSGGLKTLAQTRPDLIVQTLHRTPATPRA
jgi:tRNA 2-thiouridine synthesizing protein A